MNAIGSGRDGGFGGTATINGSNAVTVGGNLGINAGGSAPANTVGINGGVGQGGTVTLTHHRLDPHQPAPRPSPPPAIGGNVTAPVSSTGGAGIGGTINVISTGGTIDLGTLTGFGMFGRGGAAQTGRRRHRRDAQRRGARRHRRSRQWRADRRRRHRRRGHCGRRQRPGRRREHGGVQRGHRPPRCAAA